MGNDWLHDKTLDQHKAILRDWLRDPDGNTDTRAMRGCVAEWLAQLEAENLALRNFKNTVDRASELYEGALPWQPTS
ncbi:MAG TPA: hypothetical protein PLE19_12900 [Planctomycetota bacterium]|nr:hypothetical protein [Planctomycetota bacterium]HRR82614.1 hypothetical protein [Planctomycetota bacterium]HRT94792.1 hypothetical protein [Planctomycetota bacterium]